MSEYVLEMKHVTKRFPGVIALNDVSIAIKPGEIFGICGENGAGKSTLMKVLSGSYPWGTYEGEIYFNGELVKLTSVAVAEKFGIEMVYQELNMLLDGTVAENVYVGNLPGKGVFVDYIKLYKDTQEQLDALNIHLNPRQKVRGLQSGVIQMLALCRACVKKPKILVLDEPTSSLTDAETEALMNRLRELKAQGVSCIYISHKLEEVFEICDRVQVMRDGQCISCRPVAEVTRDMLIEDMIGRKMENQYPKIKVPIGEEVFRVENLSVPHPAVASRDIVKNISFNLRKGEILGLGGLVGAGRSETLGGIFGQYKKGVRKKIFIDGKEVHIREPKDASKHGFGYITEERKTTGIIWMLSILENIIVASLDHLPGKFFLNKKAAREKAQAMFDRLRIKAPSLDTMVGTLSGGNQQKVLLGRWLLKEPRILLMDEPTKGIDVGAKAEIYTFMGELVKSGVSIIMVSSDMPELIAMSDRVIVLSEGRITGEFEGDEITDNNLMRAAIA